jgi:GH35 family endo-1,4-beta-xylanase
MQSRAIIVFGCVLVSLTGCDSRPRDQPKKPHASSSSSQGQAPSSGDKTGSPAPNDPPDDDEAPPPDSRDAGTRADDSDTADAGKDSLDGTLRTAAQHAGARFIGTAVAAQPLASDTRYAGILATDFSSVTCENEMKWGALEAKRGSWDFAAADRIVSAAQAAGAAIKGHTLVWHAQLPSWVSGLNRDELLDALHEHIVQTAGHFKGKLYSWDVVNEAIDPDTLQLRAGIHSTLGISGLAQAYRWVKEVDPSALLFYNDFGIEAPGAKTDAVYQLVKDLNAAGAKLDGIGLQAHLDTAGYPAESQLRATLEHFAELGLEVTYSELDVKTKTADPKGSAQRRAEAQSLVYQLVAGVCATERACPGITLWGFTDNATWIKADDPLIYDASFHKKPAHAALLRGFAKQTPIASNDLLDNGDFASNDTAGWAAYGGGKLVAQRAVARAGAGGELMGREQTYDGVGQSVLSKLQSGDTVCGSGWLRVDAASAPVAISLKSTLDGVTSYFRLADATAADTEFRELAGCRPVYFDAAPSDLLVYFEGPPADVILYVDDAKVWTLSAER